MDGALSNNMPLFEQRNTITVAPFSGESDICPREGTFNFFETHYSNVSIQVNTGNVHRVCTSFLPPKIQVCPCPELLDFKGSLSCQKSERVEEKANLYDFRFCTRQKLAEICHNGYMDALRFLRERGELFHFNPPHS